jgi:hypothetical protein
MDINEEKLLLNAKRAIIYSLGFGFLLGLLSIWDIGSPEFIAKGLATVSLVFFTAMLFLMVSSMIFKKPTDDNIG